MTDNVKEIVRSLVELKLLTEETDPFQHTTRDELAHLPKELSLSKKLGILRSRSVHTVDHTPTNKTMILYHGTRNPHFDPKHPPSGIHYGTLRAAKERLASPDTQHIGVDPATGKRTNLATGKPKIYAYWYKAKGKGVDLDDEERYAESHGEQLARHGIIPKGTKADEDVATMKHHLAAKGISHIRYKNTVEHPGSTSHVVYDTENLQYIHDPKTEG